MPVRGFGKVARNRKAKAMPVGTFIRTLAPQAQTFALCITQPRPVILDGEFARPGRHQDPATGMADRIFHKRASHLKQLIGMDRKARARRHGDIDGNPAAGFCPAKDISQAQQRRLRIAGTAICACSRAGTGQFTLDGFGCGAHRGIKPVGEVALTCSADLSRKGRQG